MPPLPAAGPVVQIRLIYSTGEPVNPGVRFFMAYTGGPPTPADLIAMATAVSVEHTSHLAPLLSSSIPLVQVECLDLSTSPATEGSWFGSASGTRAGSIPTIDTAVNLGFTITRRYRGGKSRVYLPFGITTDLANPSTWQTTFTNAVQSDWAAFIAGVQAITGVGCTLDHQTTVSYFAGHTANPNPSVWSKKNIPARRVTPALDPVTGYAAGLKISVQRRRRGTT